jgi:hypothetical protein
VGRPILMPRRKTSKRSGTSSPRGHFQLGQRRGRTIRPSSRPITVNQQPRVLQVLEDATLITTLPIFWPVSTYRYASTIWSN